MKVNLTPEQRRTRVHNGKDIFRIMRDILMREEKIERDKEHFWLVGLAANNTLLFTELIHIGTFESTPAGPNEIFRVSIVKNAAKVIFVHNHPSGEAKPSGADEDATNRLIQAALLLNIQVIDHLIITSRSYFSFADEGLLDILAFDSIYEPKYIAEQKARALAIQERNRHIAVKMLNDGFAPEIVSTYAEMTVEEVVKIQKELKGKRRG